MKRAKPHARDLIREVKREFKRVRAEVEPKLLERMDEPGNAHLENPEFRNIMVAQNVLRPCVEALLDELRPFSHLTVLELGVRMASYVLSSAPLQDQDKLVELFLASLPDAHRARLAQGVVIRTEWSDGQAAEPAPNFPTEH